MEGEAPGVAALLGLLQREPDQLGSQSGQDGLDQRVEDRRQRAALELGVDEALGGVASALGAAIGRRVPDGPTQPPDRRRRAAQQHVDHVELIRAGGGDGLQLLQMLGEPGHQTFGQPIRRADLRTGGGEVVRRRDQRGELDRRWVRRGALGPSEEVPVVLEPLGDGPQLRVRDAELQPQRQGPLELGPFDELGVEGPEALVEVELGGDLVLHGDRRREPSLEGERGEHPLGEGVQRAQGGLVEVVEGGGEARRGALLADGPLLERHPDAVAQLVGGLLRERDGGDRLDRRTRGDQGHHPVDELGGLAGPGPGGHEQGRVEVVRDALPDGLVGQRRGRRRSCLAPRARRGRRRWRERDRHACAATGSTGWRCRRRPGRSTRTGTAARDPAGRGAARTRPLPSPPSSSPAPRPGARWSGRRRGAAAGCAAPGDRRAASTRPRSRPAPAPAAGARPGRRWVAAAASLLRGGPPPVPARNGPSCSR